jgi:hypothetical protein
MTWVSNSVPHNSWSLVSGVASSADGNRLFAAPYRTGVLTVQLTPSPQINVAVSNNNLALSWLVSSMNFVLQQNQDLTPGNWVTLTNKPTLNYTNLNYQLSLSPTNTEGFFRLSTP